MEPRYEICCTTDNLGGRYFEAQVMSYAFDLKIARRDAGRLERDGKAGFVRRASDGAVLAPDGQWIDSHREAG